MTAYDGLNDCVIFDFETLSTDRVKGVVVNMALLTFSEGRYTSNIPYTYNELVDNCKLIKFDIDDQVKNYSRVISKDTLEWWGKQSKEAKKQLNPSPDDKSISELFHFWVVNITLHNLKKVYSRGNTFDPIILDYILEQTGTDPSSAMKHWQIRDTRSTIEGMAWGHNISNSFIPDGLDEHFIAHDPRHDIAMDVMRMQTLAQALKG